MGTFLVTRTLLPLLFKKQTRTIVQISSGLGSISGNRVGMTEPEKNPVANKWIAYNASKAALNMRKCTPSLILIVLYSSGDHLTLVIHYCKHCDMQTTWLQLHTHDQRALRDLYTTHVRVHYTHLHT